MDAWDLRMSARQLKKGAFTYILGRRYLTKVQLYVSEEPR